MTITSSPSFLYSLDTIGYLVKDFEDELCDIGYDQWRYLVIHQCKVSKNFRDFFRFARVKLKRFRMLWKPLIRSDLTPKILLLYRSIYRIYVISKCIWIFLKTDFFVISQKKTVLLIYLNMIGIIGGKWLQLAARADVSELHAHSVLVVNRSCSTRGSTKGYPRNVHCNRHLPVGGGDTVGRSGGHSVFCICRNVLPCLLSWRRPRLGLLLGLMYFVISLTRKEWVEEVM